MSDGDRLVVTAVDAAALDRDALVALYRSVGWTAYTEEPERLVAAIAGSARVVSDGVSIAYLQDLLVDPAHQRTGIGRALVGAVMQPFAGVRQRVLLTDDQPRQRAFYESLGDREAGEHPAGPLRAFVRFTG